MSTNIDSTPSATAANISQQQDNSRLLFNDDTPNPIGVTVSWQEQITVNHGLLFMPRLCQQYGVLKEYTFTIAAYVTAPVNPETGMSVDLLELIKAMRSVLGLPPYLPIHEDANQQLPNPPVNGGETHRFLDLVDNQHPTCQIPATAEHFCVWFYRKLKPFVDGFNTKATLCKVTVATAQGARTKYAPLLSKQ